PQRSTFSIGVLPAARSTELSMRRSVSCSVADASLAQYSLPMVLTHRAALPAILIQIKSPNLAIGFHMLSGESGVSIVEDMMTTAKTVTIAAALAAARSSAVHRWRWFRTVHRRAANCRWRAALVVGGMAGGIPAMAMVTREPRYTTTPRPRFGKPPPRT